ncbi:SDR family oxidoreductase, partial [Escherichia coli]|nr:SDR family oxidoreductase [Escherichia coli]
GTSSSSSMADKVVQEIKSAGGQAVANYDSVEFGDKIVKTAIDNFGRIDIVINNAGILRDVSFLKMTELDWDLIFKVHVKGAYAVTKAAWPYMRDQKYGRIVVTSSNAGVHGNFGQANYAAAKSALIGLSNSLAQEGAKYNILANTLVPTAGSRPTETVMPQNLVDALKPDYVTPLVTYMVHDSFEESGKVFEAGAGWYGTIQYYKSKGKVISHASADDIAKNWSTITNMNGAEYIGTITEQSARLVSILEEHEASSGSSSA